MALVNCDIPILERHPRSTCSPRFRAIFTCRRLPSSDFWRDFTESLQVFWTKDFSKLFPKAKLICQTRITIREEAKASYKSFIAYCISRHRWKFYPAKRCHRSVSRIRKTLETGGGIFCRCRRFFRIIFRKILYSTYCTRTYYYYY